MKVYHCSTHSYNVGDTIKKGRWGNFIKNKYSNEQQAWMEFYFESIRKTIVPIATSRLDCVFAFDDINVAEGFTIDNDKKIYEIDLDENNTYSTHNYKVISLFVGLLKIPYNNNFPMLFDNLNLIEKYWKGEETDYKTFEDFDIGYQKEYLISKDVTVTKVYK
jgi:hypothetical protein